MQITVIATDQQQVMGHVSVRSDPCANLDWPCLQDLGQQYQHQRSELAGVRAELQQVRREQQASQEDCTQLQAERKEQADLIATLQSELETKRALAAQWEQANTTTLQVEVGHWVVHCQVHSS